MRYLSDTDEGKKHDKAIADEEELRFPPGSTLWQDGGFQGFTPAGVTIQQPKKTPRNGSLTAIDPLNNQSISSLRNWADHYVDDVMETACGLHNFRLTHRAKKGNPLGQAA